MSSDAADAARALLDEVAALAQNGSAGSLPQHERLFAQAGASAHQPGGGRVLGPAVCRPGGGRMLGLAICRTGKGERRLLRAFSGLWEGGSNLAGWVPPLAFSKGEAAWKTAGEARLATLSAQLVTIEAGLHDQRAELLRAQAAQKLVAAKERAALSEAQRLSRIRRHHLRDEANEMPHEVSNEVSNEMSSALSNELTAALHAESRADHRALRDLNARHRQQAAAWVDKLAALDAPLRPLLRSRQGLSRRMMRRIQRETMIASYRHADMPLEQVFLAGAAAPTGAGDCCAPKLIQAAIRLGWQIESMAEIWFGVAPASGRREHGSFHGACAEKCQPLLGFMLCGLPAAMSEEEPSVSAAAMFEDDLGGLPVAMSEKDLYEPPAAMLAEEPSAPSATLFDEEPRVSSASEPACPPHHGRSAAPALSGPQPVLPSGSARQAIRLPFVPPDMRGVELPVLFHDPHFVVVDKPTGLLSVPGRGPAAQDCVIARVWASHPESEGPMMVHRLDMDCSGLMLVALKPDSQRCLSMQFAARQVVKHYVALLDGRLVGSEGEIELAFRLDPADRPRQIYDPERGKPGISRWRRIGLEIGPDGRSRTRVYFEPITGRTHQLRLHASHPAGLGLAIVGDRLYGGADGGADGSTRLREGRTVGGNLRFEGSTAAASERLMLHACHLAFDHPVSGERMQFDSPPPF